MKNVYLSIVICTLSAIILNGCTSFSKNSSQQTTPSTQTQNPSNHTQKSDKGFFPADEYDPKTCHLKFIDGVRYEPIDRGIPKDRFVELMPIQEFKAKLESALGDYYTAQSSDSNEFTLPKLNGSLYVRWNKHNVLKVYYTTLYNRERSKYGHQLLPAEKFAMTELINIFVNDKAKSEQLLQQLYQQYMLKVQNHETLEDNESIVAYIEYDGKIFGLSGLQRINHPLPHCDIEVLSGLSIE